MKKILLITSFFESPYHQNRAPYNEQLFLELKSYFNINIIRPIAWTDIQQAEQKHSKKEYYKSDWNGIPIYYPTYYFAPRIALSTNGRMYYNSILKSVKNTGVIPDIYYTTWAYPDAYATMKLAQKNKRKYVVRVHGSDINDLLFRKEIQDKVKSVLMNAALVISPSQALKDKMISAGIPEQKNQVIYSGVDDKKFYPLDRASCEKELNLKAGKKRILYIGNFKKAKGVADLVKAANLLKNEFPDFEVLLIGKGEEHNYLKTFLKENNLEEIVKIVGPVDHHKLNPWINSSDCVCLPSYAEGMPNVLLESLACKTKIVATNVGGIPEIYKDEKDYFMQPGDIATLSNRLANTLSGKIPELKPSIPIENYKTIAKQITSLIEKIL